MTRTSRFPSTLRNACGLALIASLSLAVFAGMSAAQDTPPRPRPAPATPPPPALPQPPTGPPPPPPAPGTPEAALLDARNVLAAGRAAEAERMFRALIAREPGLAEAHRGLADAIAAQDRGEEAAGVLARLGDGLIDAGLYEPAVEALRRGAALAPAGGALAARLHAQLGRALLLDRNPAAAIDSLQRAVTLGHADLRTRQYLGAALWEDGRLEEAEIVHRKLVEDSGGAASAVQELGRLLLWQGRAAEAVELLRRAAAADPSNADPWLELARALEAVDRPAEAEEAYRKAVELAPQRSDARYGLGLLLARSEKEGAKAEADKQFETYRHLTAEERESTRREGLERVRLDRGWSLLHEGKTAEAEKQFGALPASAESLAGVAAARAAAGDHVQAVQALERAVALAPSRRDLRLKLAEERLLAAGRQ